MFGVGEALGRRPTFLPPQEVARLALTPGSVMHRLVTDPVTGRCLERSTQAYPFTAAMKTQIAFADGMCRAPGCTKPAAASQFDHVTAHAAGGHTCEANGALAHPPHHDQKTKEYLDVVINDRRDMTWETLLGKIYKTKAHDYTQYSTMLTEATGQVLAAEEEDRAEALDRAIYQALSYKPGGTTRLISGEDEPYGEDQFLSWDSIRLTRRNPKTGRKINGPNPDIVTAERARHTRATDPEDTNDQAGSEADGGADRADGTDRTDGTDGAAAQPGADTPEHGPWATPDDNPPPF
ncbi:MAG: HNH endonuclease [Actinomycetales bacterium]|nr:HNH endonuclease [Actinomycetales bacterium]